MSRLSRHSISMVPVDIPLCRGRPPPWSMTAEILGQWIALSSFTAALAKETPLCCVARGLPAALRWPVYPCGLESGPLEARACIEQQCGFARVSSRQ